MEAEKKLASRLSEKVDMVSVLNTLDPKALKNVVGKTVVYNKLMDLAQKYIDHKLPAGKKRKRAKQLRKKSGGFCKRCHWLRTELQARSSAAGKSPRPARVGKKHLAAEAF